MMMYPAFSEGPPIPPATSDERVPWLLHARAFAVQEPVPWPPKDLKTRQATFSWTYLTQTATSVVGSRRRLPFRPRAPSPAAPSGAASTLRVACARSNRSKRSACRAVLPYLRASWGWTLLKNTFYNGFVSKDKRGPLSRLVFNLYGNVMFDFLRLVSRSRAILTPWCIDLCRFIQKGLHCMLLFEIYIKAFDSWPQCALTMTIAVLIY